MLSCDACAPPTDRRDRPAGRALCMSLSGPEPRRGAMAVSACWGPDVVELSEAPRARRVYTIYCKRVRGATVHIGLPVECKVPTSDGIATRHE